MGKKESLYPKDWFNKAAKDMKRVEILLKEDDIEGAGFHLQQTIEKYLKGYLLAKGEKLRRLHELDDLLDLVLEYDSRLERFRSLCEEVTEYYIEERYPFVTTSGVTKEEVERNLAEAKELRDKIMGEFEAEKGSKKPH